MDRSWRWPPVRAHKPSTDRPEARPAAPRRRACPARAAARPRSRAPAPHARTLCSWGSPYRSSSRSIPGHLITGRPTDDPVAIAAGWSYHLWNGVGIAVMYTLIAGRAHVKYAVGWAMAMEAAWLVTVPSVINVKPHVQLVVVSIIGHLAYGAALGWAARRWVRA